MARAEGRSRQLNGDRTMSSFGARQVTQLYLWYWERSGLALFHLESLAVESDGGQLGT